MTSPKGWDTAEAARLHRIVEQVIVASLHDIGCAGPSDCTCERPVFIVEDDEE